MRAEKKEGFCSRAAESWTIAGLVRGRNLEKIIFGIGEKGYPQPGQKQ